MECGRGFPRWSILRLLPERRVDVGRKQSLLKKPLLTRPDQVPKLYGAKLAEVFRTPLYDCSLKNVCGVPDFALTRLKGGPMGMQRAPEYPEDRAILICVALALTPVDRWRTRIAGDLGLKLRGQARQCARQSPQRRYQKRRCAPAIAAQ